MWLQALVTSIVHHDLTAECFQKSSGCLCCNIQVQMLWAALGALPRKEVQNGAYATNEDVKWSISWSKLDS